MRAKVLAFPINGPVRAGWSSQELAEIYRLEHLLGQRGLLSEIGSGVTDEGDPWLVVYDPSGTDIVANITRVAGRYLVVRIDAPDPAYAASLREIANSVVHGTPLPSEAAPESETDEEDLAAASWVFVVDEHPDAMPGADHLHATESDHLPAIPADERLEEMGRLLLALIVGVAEMQHDAAEAAQQFEATLALADPADDQSAPPTPAATEVAMPELAATDAASPAPAVSHGDGGTIDLAALDDLPATQPDPARAGISPADGIGAATSDESASQPAASAGPDDSATAQPAAAATDDQLRAASQGPVEASQSNAPTNQNDLIIGTDGNDFIDTGFGDDTIRAGAGNDTVLAGPGNDSVEGGSGDDVLSGDDGDDTLLGGDGNDELRGGSGHNIIDTGSGNNLVISGSGHDTVSLGEGHDLVVVIPGSSGNTTVTDFDESTDRLVVIGLGEGSSTTVDPSNPGTQVINVTPDTTITITGTTPLHDPLV